MATFPCLGPPACHRLLLVLLITCLCHVTQGARVLLLPFPDTSQCRQLVSIGRELQSRGHQVILFVPDYFRVRRCTEPAPHTGNKADVEIRTFDTLEETAEAVESKLDRLGYEVMGGGTGLLGGSSTARAAFKEICRSFMDAKDDLDKLRRGGRVDVVLLDGSPYAHCLALLPAYIGSPFVAVSSYIRPYDSATPLPTSYYPAPLSGLTANLGFLQRLSNFFSYAADAGGDLWGGFNQGNDLGPKISRLEDDQLIKKALLYLENSDHVVDYPKATFPNFVQVGGVTAGPAGPLPGPLGQFFDEAGEGGVVVVSLGPHVFTPNKNLEDKLITAFRKQEARVLMRLNASRVWRRVKNVQTVSWFPQNDALGHPATKLFVSHCGKNSFFEALHHGVPILCCHFAGSDTLGTGLRVAEFGIGMSIDLLSATPDSLKTAVTNLLTDKSFSRRAKAASRLFHSRQGSPAHRAASAVEHVLKFGGGYLRPRAIDMSFFQYAGLDIALVLFSFVLGVAGLLCLLVSKQLSSAPKEEKGEKEKEKKVKVSKTPVPEANNTPVKKPAVTSEESTRSSRIIMTSVFGLVILFYIFV
ncbi:UDP-glucuronosyltransferase 2C1-like [Littorina saxatilis]|uniref:Uncharacterized protein n=1 Tax=Littorina saxatilis TaxID=31220 RepID=A0AAN9BQ77_9CAEN